MSTKPPASSPVQHSGLPIPQINNSIPVISTPSSISIPTPTPTPKSETHQPFRFLDLSIEIRLQIYTYLLPPRTHTITTRIPSNPFFYNSSFSSSSPSAETSLYPFGKSAPRRNVTYSVTSSPSQTSKGDGERLEIYPEILRVSKQVLRESEPVLYGHPDVVWDFGLTFEGLPGFLGQRSDMARGCIRNIRGAGCVTGGVDQKFLSTTQYIQTQLTGLQNIVFTIWGERFGDSSKGGEKYLVSFGAGNQEREGNGDNGDGEGWKERKWREWEWTRGFFEVEGLRRLVVREWRFGEGGEKEGLDGWLARQMVGSRLVRDRMVREGVVVERRFVVCL